MEKIKKKRKIPGQAPFTQSSHQHSETGQPYMASSLSETSSLRLDSLASSQSAPTFVYILTFFSAIGGFLFGYDTGVISGAMILLREEFRLNSVWQEMVVSITIAAAAVFALIGGLLNDVLGRKPVITLASLVFTAGSLCLALADSRVMLLAGRLIVGAGIGLTSTTIPMYIAEASPAYVRGRLVSTNVVMIACGQFVANVVDGIFSFETDGWRYMLGLGAIPAVIQFIGFIFMPESPSWLIIRGNEDKARLVLQRMRGSEDIEEEFETIKQNYWDVEQDRLNTSSAPVLVQMWRTPAVRRALLVGCSLQMIQQLAGINTVMYYSATIIKMSGVRSESAAIWLSAVTAAVNFLFTLLGLWLVERIGRRPLTLGSLIGAIVSLAWLAIGFNLASIYSPGVTLHEPSNADNICDTYRTCDSCMRNLFCGFCYEDTVDGPLEGSCLQSDYNDYVTSRVGRCNSTHAHTAWAYDYCPTPFAWMAMVGLVLYLIFFAPGMGPMPWTINSEIYPLWARSTGNSVATFTNWVCNLLVSMSFLSLTETLTRYGTFWLYAGLATLGLVFLALVLPETKGASLETVEGLFARPWSSTLCPRGGAGTGGGGTRGDEAFGDSGVVSAAPKSVQYVHIRGLNRDCRESETESIDGD